MSGRRHTKLFMIATSGEYNGKAEIKLKREGGGRVDFYFINLYIVYILLYITKRYLT